VPRVRIEIEGLRCTRCGHEWVPRRDWHPFVCPRCKSPFWDRARMIRQFRAEAVIQWRQGGPPDETRVADFEKRLGQFRHPRLRWMGKRLKVGVDVQASTVENAEIQARRLIVNRARAAGLSGYGVKTKIDIAVKPTD
jgi:predicted RNA-binding Zn-ribbon protein involved in translation (DUF1610 family)